MTLAFVACYQDIPSAVIALQRDGSIGQLYVEPSLRRKHIAMALVTYLCNKMLENGQVPFVYLPKEQSDMQELYKKTGFYVSADSICMIQPQEGL
ncbi:GNAT family N-acetyltransferase [Agathobacter ruminis]